MKQSAFIPVYALTLLLSASLLFSVQPLFSRMILPLLGGTPQVWNTAMLFFQVVLLAGYGYAHLSSRFLSLRLQVAVQLALLGIFTLFLPLAIPAGWIPPATEDPTLWQLSVMAAAVGGPFFVLAGSAPLFQHWFSRSGHKDAGNPYFLYGASNLGSMSALLAYPFIIEPLLNLQAQTHVWMMGYFALIMMVMLCGAFIWNARNSPLAATEEDHTVVTWRQRGLWLLLAFVPSSLMLGVTTYITTDIASVPLLWIIPLSLYVATFILVFARRQYIPRRVIMLVHGLLVIGLIPQLLELNIPLTLLVVFHMALFFFSALACHTELAALRPSARHLTEFYLVMAVGGALGGFFNAIIAPNFFIVPLEYGMALAVACFLRYAANGLPSLHFNARNAGIVVAVIAIAASSYFSDMLFARGVMAFAIVCGLLWVIEKRFTFAIALAGIFILLPPGDVSNKVDGSTLLLQDRNFFAVMRIYDNNQGQRVLLHGTTLHGEQLRDPRRRNIPLSYYGVNSPIRNIFSYLGKNDGQQNVAVIGLGVGTMSCYARQGRNFDFFEIDPDIVRIAQNPDYFTYLAECGSPYSVILGDGRLTLQKQPDHSYDAVIIDAFSSDNIPIHLLTIEAIQTYLQKLKAGGMIVFHISNRYLDLEPVLAQAAKDLNLTAYAKVSKSAPVDGTEVKTKPAHYVAFLTNEAPAEYLQARQWGEAKFRDNVRTWTDSYSNILSAFGNDSVSARYKEQKQRAKQ